MTMIGASHGAADPGPSCVWADDVLVALAPSRSYSRLIDRSQPTTWRQALSRPALVLLVVGTATAIAATGRVTLSGIASGMLLWSWVIGIQFALGAFLIASSRSRRVGMPGALKLFFAAHIPWSLWVAGIGMWAASGLDFSLELAICIGLFASVWTAVILAAFNRIALGATSTGSWVLTVVHQCLIWVVALSYIAWMSGGWFRLMIW